MGRVPASRRSRDSYHHASDATVRFLSLHWDDAPLFAVEILWRAHDPVAFGWCQGADATDANTSPSSHGVHARAALLTELHLALVAISDVIPAWTLQHWNDHPKRTQTGVIEMLAAAHEHCRAATVANRP